MREKQDQGVAFGPGCQPSASAASADAPASSRSGIPNAEELAARLANPAFQREQAAQLLATEIGYQLRCIRILRGLTIAELSAESGVGVVTLKQIERGEWLKGIRVLADIAHALDCAITMKLVPREETNRHPQYVPSFDEEDAASGVEAATADEARSGSAEGESPVPQADAQGEQP